MKTVLLAGLVAFVVSLVFCALLIPALRKWKAGQNILSYVKEHKSKSGTPTMGGIAFVLPCAIVCAVFLRGGGKAFAVTLATGLAYMCVGLLDDFLKCKRKDNLGLTAWQKTGFMLAVAIVVSVFAYRIGLTELYLPFFHKTVNAGAWIIPLSAFVFIATVNAVNLTDGLDGLAGGVSVPYFATLGTIITLQNGDSAYTTLCFCLVGGLLAYLVFNCSPASVFMGDTGSLALGGFASCIALFTGNALYIPVIGALFVFSVISVVIQVIYYKATGGKRIFLMSPAHHHFQQKGFAESKIAYAYSLITTIIGAVCVWSLL
ncbi:MAG: phospho-N-acetylmuramoyl-pentapeptide-transferase [Clostridia bacterium]|nr:phospho-N-acetylmuramoyl-pentapeptide-transferase [Clostridia bacterium]